VYWECTFYSNAVSKLADCECLANTRTLATDNESLEELDTALVALDNTNVDLDLISRTEANKVLAE
jgi:hypothetical protein